MMNCHDFKKWIAVQGSSDEQQNMFATAHIRHCEVCNQLFKMDAFFEDILKEEMKATEPPPNLIANLRRKIESDKIQRSHQTKWFSWKIYAPAFAMATLLLIIVMNPFSGQLRSIDEVVAHSITNHLDTKLTMAFRAGEVTDAGLWFSESLGFPVKLPDLKRLGLTLLGGRNCILGRIDAAYLFYKAKEKRVSLFIINESDLDFTLTDGSTYNIVEKGFSITIWKEGKMVYSMVT